MTPSTTSDRRAPDQSPFISLTTDFGSFYSGICVGVLARLAPAARVLVVTADLPRFAVTAGAVQLRAALPYLPVGIHLGIVDPGVGTDRLPIAIRCARGDVLIGPDNGLLVPAAQVLGGVYEARALAAPDLRLPNPAPTFHGRDIFAPAAAYLADGVPLSRFGPSITPVELDRPRVEHDTSKPGAVRAVVLFVDAFGNLVLGAEPADLAAAPGSRLLVQGHAATRTDTFAAVAPGGYAVLVDSSGWLAVAVNRGDAARELGLGPGDPVLIEVGSPA
ncbi:S-adenosyl-l-methionine hydroxide adenosyltransferase family protein [Skermania piniformis]|uniref:SAM-dependent chlorinase/fluorinase n=1 Tax=Skermania pinensis TaxID=39122 RepID=A0ABX8S3G8_9ACTN|nr:SAM-dependent chlorinase/fluorinase [Skermania piniformis]QXQ12344.1 SAM-dependent chlorinase/fluorinase [Skermania piniformis]